MAGRAADNACGRKPGIRMSGVWESDFMAPFLFLLFMMVAQVGEDANGKDFSDVAFIVVVITIFDRVGILFLTLIIPGDQPMR